MDEWGGAWVGVWTSSGRACKRAINGGSKLLGRAELKSARPVLNEKQVATIVHESNATHMHRTVRGVTPPVSCLHVAVRIRRRHVWFLSVARFAARIPCSSRTSCFVIIQTSSVLCSFALAPPRSAHGKYKAQRLMFNLHLP